MGILTGAGLRAKYPVLADYTAARIAGRCDREVGALRPPPFILHYFRLAETAGFTLQKLPPISSPHHFSSGDFLETSHRQPPPTQATHRPQSPQCPPRSCPSAEAPHSPHRRRQLADLLPAPVLAKTAPGAPILFTAAEILGDLTPKASVELRQKFLLLFLKRWYPVIRIYRP